MIPREAIYKAIDTERAYQLKRWGVDVALTETGPGNTHTLREAPHSLEEWVLYMEDYLQEARTQLSRMSEPDARDAALHTLRKVVSMGVAAFEEHGCPIRGPGPVTNGRTGKVYE